MFQVEHPITELVSGEDLVEHMLRIAAGHPLPQRLTSLPHQCIQARGWAVESRVYAEDPLKNFLPSVGPLITYKEPETHSSDTCSSEGSDMTVRVDGGVFEGGQVSMFYDPMLSKLATHASSRPSAISAMKRAIDGYVIRGVENNLCFLRSVLDNEKFVSGDYGTHFISEQYPKGFTGVHLNQSDEFKVIAFAAVISRRMHRQEGMVADVKVVSLPSDASRKGKDYVVHCNHAKGWMEFSILPIESLAGTAKAEPLAQLQVEHCEWIDGQPLAKLSFRSLASGVSPTELEVMQYEGRTMEGVRIRYKGAIQEVIVRTTKEHILSRHMPPPRVKDTSNLLLSPMSGKLLSLSVANGDRVYPGQALAVVEAMKMQNVLKASKAGVVKEIKSIVGSHLKIDQIILEFE